MALIARAVGSALLGLGPALLCLSGLSWISLLAIEDTLRASVCGSMLGLWSAVGSAPFTYLTAAGVWSAMTLAMMAPALGPPLDHVWRSSPRRYRLVALVTFMTGYLLVWIAAGIGVVTASAFLAARMAPSHLALAALAVMLAWQLSPGKQACLNRCHQLMPLAPFGLEAVADQATFGMRVGLWCAGSCWALMLAMLVATAGHWAFMLAASVLIFFERQLPARPARWAAVLRS